jgi:3-phenylpropionate/trans-cinnamate dioxygenase ferredoxin subunit
MGPIPDEFVAVAKTGDLAPGQMTFVAIDRERIVLANVDGAFYALRDVCGHRNAPLSRGRLDGHLIECPLHFATFDVRTGKLVDGPVSADIPSYEVRVAGGCVYLKREKTG